MTRIFFIVKTWWLPVFIFGDLRHTTRRSSVFNVLIFVDILVTKAANIQYSHCWAPTEIGTQLCGLHCSRQNQSLAPKQRTFKIATAGRRRYLLLICGEYKFAAKSISLSPELRTSESATLGMCSVREHSCTESRSPQQRLYAPDSWSLSPGSSFNRRRSGRRAINCIHDQLSSQGCHL